MSSRDASAIVTAPPAAQPQGTSAALVLPKASCSKLPSPGAWENVSPPAFLNPPNMETLAVAVSPEDGVVFAAAGNKTNGGDSGTGVYRSVDCGATWERASTGAGSEKLGTGDPWALLIPATKPTTIYVNNGYGQEPTIYRSTNGGVDFTALDPDSKDVLVSKSNHVQAMAVEKGNPKHIAVTFHDNCGPPFTGNCLSKSIDGGTTWQMFPGPANLKGWLEAASLSVLGPSSYLYTCDSGIYFTEDTGKTWSQPLKGGLYGSYGGSTHIGPDGTLYLGVGNAGIFTSNPKNGPIGKVWSAEPLKGSPRNVGVLIDDGKHLYASWSWDSGGQPFSMAPLSDLTAWKPMKSPPIARGSNQLAYDSKHHVLYSANWGAGLWRVVTEP
ncbi:MAG: exo-alpha-sialidase [Myxococcales bacterium]|nr:MAG: exo-alpha-sialidase [Myxococcales bacterium]